MDVISLEQFLRFFLALVFVLALMGGLAVCLRRLENVKYLRAARERRLAVVETLAVDARRKLVLVRKDGREHLLILGANGETLIESADQKPQDSPVPPAADGAEHTAGKAKALS